MVMLMIHRVTWLDMQVRILGRVCTLREGDWAERPPGTCAVTLLFYKMMYSSKWPEMYFSELWYIFVQKAKYLWSRKSVKGQQEPWRHQTPTQELHQVPVEPVVAVTVQNFSCVNHLLALAQRASDRVCQNRCTPSNSVNLRPAPVSRQSLKITSTVSMQEISD